MIDIATQTIDYYFKHLKKPELSDLEIKDPQLIESQGKVFVTLYINGEVRWASWNIQEVETSLALEIVENTIAALSTDSRFDPITMNESKNIKIRIDQITNRNPLGEWEYQKIDPVKSWILVIEKEYKNLACILPNMSSKLLTGEDFIPVLREKLKIPHFQENDYIIYAIETHTLTNY